MVPDSPQKLSQGSIKNRRDRHILFYETVGLKTQAGDKCYGYSTGTNHDEEVNTVLQRDEPIIELCARCDLVFHGAELDTGDSVVVSS